MAVSFISWMNMALSFLVLVLSLFSVLYPKKTWIRIVQLVLATTLFFSCFCILYMEIQKRNFGGVILLGVSLIILYSAIIFGAYGLGKHKERNKDKAD